MEESDETTIYSWIIWKPCPRSQLSGKKKLEAAKRAGFDFVEISTDMTRRRRSWDVWTHVRREPGSVFIGGEVSFPYTICVSADTASFPLGSSDPAVRSRGMGDIGESNPASRHDGTGLCSQLAGYDGTMTSPQMRTKDNCWKSHKKQTEMAKQ